MKKCLLSIGLYFSICSICFSQTYSPTLQEQINSVHTVQEQTKEAERQQEQERKEREERLFREAEQQATLKRIEANKKAEKREQELRAEKLAIMKKQEREGERNSYYQERLRDIEIESLKLEIEAKKAEVTRANDFIDQKLKKMTAETDVIQSDADVNRNLSEGTKTLLETTNLIPKTKHIETIVSKDDNSWIWKLVASILGIILIGIISFFGFGYYKNKKLKM